jgi:hypothetical protein
MRKFGNKQYGGRYVTISKTWHEIGGLFSYAYRRRQNMSLIKMEGPITYFASETDFIIQPLLWKNIS